MERAPVWGYSRGGRLAYLVALLAPERCSALVVGGVAALGAAESAARYAGLAALLRRSPVERFLERVGV